MTFELSLNPSEQIVYKGAMNVQRVCELHITNPTEKGLAWKVKCTDNEIFRIRPVVGLLKPSEEVTVLLTAMAREQKPTRTQYFAVFQMETADDATDAREVWQAAKGNEAGKRLTVAFEDDGEKADEAEEEKPKEAEQKKEEPKADEAAKEAAKS